jgi:NAD+ kinase
LKKLADKIKCVGLIGNADKPECGSIMRRAARLVARAGRQPLQNQDTAALARQAQLLLVFGGDGTMLHVAREIAGSPTPMLGVLTAVPSTGLAHALNHIWKGEFQYEARALLEAEGMCNGQALKTTALNDIVIGRGAVPRLIGLEVCVNGEWVTRYRCDGLIISTPTGSTAYSLAAGGAVIFPTAEVIALTPICPHTLSNRPLIMPLNATLRIKADTPAPATILSADGQLAGQLDRGDEVTIRRARRTVRLMHLADNPFSEALRRKLHWRGAYL